jgi:hypothetical protein
MLTTTVLKAVVVVAGVVTIASVFGIDLVAIAADLLNLPDWTTLLG